MAGMLAMGWWGMRRAKSKSEFLVAGRRLGPWMYSGTMAAIVLGGASTIGGVGLGYKYGLSGAWMVFAIGLGLLALSVFFSARIARLKVYTFSEILDLRYGGRAGVISGAVMWAYTLMLTVTSTIAYATIFDVLFDLPRTVAIVLGTIVVAYSTLGGMWSIVAPGIVRGEIKTTRSSRYVVLSIRSVEDLIGLLPHRGRQPSLQRTGRVSYLLRRPGGSSSDRHDLSNSAERSRGESPGVTRERTPNLRHAHQAEGLAVRVHCARCQACQAARSLARTPRGSAELAPAAAFAAVMSTSSGALIACATVANNDIWSRLRGTASAAKDDHDEVKGNRLFILIMGAAVIVIAIALNDVVQALTVAYNLLVGGLLVPILGGLLWRRGTVQGALAAVTVGGLAVIGLMWTYGILANEPVYYGLLASLAAYVIVSLATRPTDAAVLAHWRARLAGQDTTGAPEPEAEAIPAATTG
ncbi:sodium:solute symporter family transporter [Streptomyces exfoliatus]|uniref:sodium:solute symporter family transporter n=1 Tax=Streptomyces exfoliatus TaxID=1905 RepID=UPI0004658A69|nr:sodium:solute symporter [Streptomyces exfoliatus]